MKLLDDETQNPLHICVLQSSYEGSLSDTKAYDNYRCTPAYAFNNSPDTKNYKFTSVLIKKATAYSQVRDLVRTGTFDAFFNLCDGALDEDRAGISVVQALEKFGVPFTGADSKHFEPTKLDMKMLAFFAGINVPAYAHVSLHDNIEAVCSHLNFPVIVKHTSGYNSVGMTRDSLCRNMEDLVAEASRFMGLFSDVLVEEYIEGVEVTVLACEDPDRGVSRAFTPVQFKFPDGELFKHFELKWVDFGKTRCAPLADPVLAEKCKAVGIAAFDHILGGVGYGRSDLRIDANGNVFMLEINPNCGIFYPDNDGSADLILANDPIKSIGFAKLMIKAAIQRNIAILARKPPVKVSFSSAEGRGYHVLASRNIAKDELVFHDEGRPLRLITKQYVDRNWSATDKAMFTQYAWPFSKKVWAIWPNDHNNWRPLSHSCNPSLWFGENSSLNVFARRNIAIGEPLTMDYATFCCGETMEFDCSCGDAACRGRIAASDYTTSSQVREFYGTRVSDYVYQQWISRSSESI
uniref:SET domain-containing protein n=1 Tax=Spongospora subterranea TaxID=70186 RepID=A0A0H5RAP0_9EUKA|eukprot:CRZ11235.1 hypothetical protein [Spongospora subterranea]